MIIEQGYLSYILRESYCQLSTGVDIAEQDIANGIGGFTSAEPHVQNGWNMRLLPSECQRASGEEGEHYGLTCIQQGFQQGALHVGKVEAGAAGALAAHLGRLAECGHDDICTGGHFQRLVQ